MILLLINYFINCIHIHTNTHTHIYIYIYIYAYVFLSGRSCAYYVYIHIYIYIYIIYTMYIYMYILCIDIMDESTRNEFDYISYLDKFNAFFHITATQKQSSLIKIMFVIYGHICMIFFIRYNHYGILIAV